MMNQYDDFNLEHGFYDDPEDFLDFQDPHDENFMDVLNYCAVLSVQSILPLIHRLVVLNLTFGIITSFISFSRASFDLLSGCVGLYLVSEVDSSKGRWILCTYFIISYLILWMNSYVPVKHCAAVGTLIKFGFIASLIISEHLLIEKQIFIRIRGILMVFVMKILSLIDEVPIRRRIGVLEYFGYTLCGANILFGPWTTLQEYKNLHLEHKKKNVFWFMGICKSLVLSVFHLTISNCWATYIIPDTSNRWMLAYRDAVSVRYSHYFVSYMAETSMIAAGFSNTQSNEKIWSYRIVSPLEIELPASLSVVVTKWNQPMHLFLKQSIYKPMRIYGQFLAVMGTFLVSSFLHGLEVSVSVVLISLGIFSYLQVKARYLMSESLSACLNVKPCKKCNHKYKRNSLVVRFILLVYMITTMIHLAYVGILMDTSSEELGILDKWQNLYFISHIMMGINLLFIS